MALRGGLGFILADNFSTRKGDFADGEEFFYSLNASALSRERY
ncbi:MAG: hypothetical protein ABIJ96_07675 [Elusimicrobiota bacterium]